MKNKETTIDLEQFGLFILVISKEEIEQFETKDIIAFLEKLKADGPQNEDKLTIAITGYDDDVRELYEIQEIRNYIQFIDRAFPFWYFFLNKKIKPQQNPIWVIFSCIVDIDEVITTEKGKIIIYNENSLEYFINLHFHFLNEITQYYNLPLEINYRISMEIKAIINSVLS